MRSSLFLQKGALYRFTIFFQHSRIFHLTMLLSRPQLASVRAVRLIEFIIYSNADRIDYGWALNFQSLKP